MKGEFHPTFTKIEQQQMHFHSTVPCKLEHHTTYQVHVWQTAYRHLPVVPPSIEPSRANAYNGQIYNRPRHDRHGNNESPVSLSDTSIEAHRQRLPNNTTRNRHRQPSPDEYPSGSEHDNERNEHRRRRRESRPNNTHHDVNANDDGESDTPHNNNIKPLQIGAWKVCFSGDTPPVNRNDVDLNEFLDQVETYRTSAKWSKAAVLSQVFNLLAGSAKTWFQLEKKNIRTWSDFERKIKENFLTSTHDNELFTKATKRKQGKTESVATYINQMRMIMQEMSEPLSEKHKLFLIQRNLHPRYTAIVASHCPQTVADVMRIAKEVENARTQEIDTDCKPKQKYRNVNTIGKASESSVDSSSEGISDIEAEKTRVAAVKTDKKAKREKKKQNDSVKDESPIGSVEVACYNCGSQDHLQRKCPEKWNKHCYRCGMPDVVLRECKNCNADSSKNAKTNSVTELSNSQSQ